MDINFTAHNSISHLQKGPNGTSILKDPLKHTNEGLRCKRNDYIRKAIPQKKGLDIF